MADKKHMYAARRRVSITGVGSLYPDTEANRQAGRLTRVELTPDQAAPYGAMLEQLKTKPIDPASVVTK
jgi:hypothetical protein